jgi:hypothetical protein
MVAAFASVVAIGVSVGLVVSGFSSPGTSAPSRATTASDALGANARSAPSPGGAAGVVTHISQSGLTLATSAGQTATVTYSTATVFDKGTKSIQRNSLKVGEDVLVYGTTSSTTIGASKVIVEPSSSSLFTTSSAVVSFTRGSPTDLKAVGAIPAGWTQGSGTIVSGTAADKATEAALAKYPGAIVDRVVKLSNGEYNVHYIGVNWPHHVFVSQNFKVLGAE